MNEREFGARSKQILRARAHAVSHDQRAVRGEHGGTASYLLLDALAREESLELHEGHLPGARIGQEIRLHARPASVVDLVKSRWPGVTRQEAFRLRVSAACLVSYFGSLCGVARYTRLLHTGPRARYKFMTVGIRYDSTTRHTAN